jgi:succinate dehydrogenase/fumarate reductase flavoprotein subunit
MAHGPWHEEVDLIIVGASTGGLAAAVIAADRGCRTLIVERTKELGGGASAEAELVAAAGTRFQQAASVDDSPARLVEDLLAASGREVEPELAAAIAEQGAPLVAWLADRCGARVSLIANQATSGHQVARLHIVGERGGASLVADLTRAATRHARIGVRTAAIGERLIRDESGAVRGLGVRTERRGSGHAIRGRILLACGGFAGDDALVTEHCAPVAGLPYHGSAAATGEGLRLGREAGAATRRLGSTQATPFLATPSHLLVAAPLVELGAILVNQSGRRFADEGGARLGLAVAVRAQPGRMAYLLFDDRIADAARAADPFFAHVVLPKTGRRGGTIEDLAKQVELNVEGVRATIEAHNASVGGGADAFGRRAPGTPLVPPFHAIRVTGARSRTLGGLAVDGAARVLDGEGRPIAGLYATGGAAAGLASAGSDGALAGVDALAALGLARLAALDVVAAIAAAEPPA